MVKRRDVLLGILGIGGYKFVQQGESGVTLIGGGGASYTQNYGGVAYGETSYGV